MDDLFERLAKTAALMGGGFLLIYVLIACSRERPTGISLAIYKTMNLIFLWGFRIVALLIVGAAAVWAIAYVHNLQEEKRIKEMKEKEIEEARLQAEENRMRQLKEKQQEEEKRKGEKESEELRKQQLIIERENCLKNRSTEEANKAALKNFI